MRIGIDFDRVLFNTEAFKDHLLNKLPEFSETYDEAVVDGVYRPQKHAEEMDTSVEEIFDELSKTPEFLYSDVGKLEKLRRNHQIVIVSRGDPVFQEEKIRDSGIMEHVDELKIVQDKPKDCVEIELLVDDLEKELERVNVPGMLFDRDKHSLEDIVQKVREMEGGE